MAHEGERLMDIWMQERPGDCLSGRDGSAGGQEEDDEEVWGGGWKGDGWMDAGTAEMDGRSASTGRARSGRKARSAPTDGQ